MSRRLSILLILLASFPAMAGLLDVYRLEDGHTNWQYVANTVGTVLIVALSYTLIRLFLLHREANRYNLALEEIRSQLEQRVRIRTATLDESNRLLKESHGVLEGEIAEHQATADRLRQSESYINSILHSMPLMLIGLGSDGVITQWNSRAEEVSRLQADYVLGKKLWQVYPSITVTPEQIENAIREDRTFSFKQSHRGRYHFDITIYPLHEQPEPGVVVLIDDVSQQVMAENMLIQRDKMSSMGELAGSLATDISTPVQAMLMDIREVQSRISGHDYELDNDPAPMLDDALLRGEQVSEVISNMRELASSNAGDMKQADITEIINHSLELASAVLTAPSGLHFRDIQIEKSYENRLPLIPCHAVELQQVFLSLFRHCIHALDEVERPGFTPRITLQANKFYDAIWLKIQHNGRGISLKEQQVLFEPFFTNSTGPEEYDAWRRLSYPYFIITEQHRGQLAVTSDVDIGTTFHIELLLV
jgi:PAS domain S-box-containing protein